MKKHLKLLLLVFAAFVLSSACTEKAPITELPPPSDPSVETTDSELSILCIGNSFTMDAVTHLPGLISSAGLKKIHIIHMYYGGRLVQQYNTGWETSNDYTGYECKPGNAAFTTFKGKTLKEVASSKDWDIVTIQEHTGSKFAWTWNTTQKSHFTELIEKVNAGEIDSPYSKSLNLNDYAK